ncbi:hypothetical protein KKG29_01010 [Patescibacteria group bacterium]|nr:hypothetical protein [Patescibacteria group bacterium]MBU3999745.1 hypothetical protein [Patescibacteria group bacterium]MBU4056546.1 hypothetical protein [Patescibacteria group bacterium]MBU4368752.1 hypothetical protein [Patescibacteria group bacterium]
MADSLGISACCACLPVGMGFTGGGEPRTRQCAPLEILVVFAGKSQNSF